MYFEEEEKWKNVLSKFQRINMNLKIM
jgi:hypothetical protein